MPNGYKNAFPDVPWWIAQVDRGKKFRDEYTRRDQWAMWRRWYRGQWAPGQLPANVYFKLMRTLIPRIYYRNPSVSITPSIPGVENMLLCKLMERADNKLIDIMGVKQSMKRSVQHAAMFGTGVLRLGYGAQFTPTPDDLDNSDPDAGTRKMRRRVEYNSLVHANMPWVLPAHPGQFVVPHGTPDINSARWVCYECVREVDDIKDDPRFRNTDFAEGLGGSHLLTRPSGLKQELRSGVLLWEIRDKMTAKVFVIAPHADTKSPKEGGRDKVLFFENDELQINRGFPAYPIVFNADDEVFWGVPYSQIIAPQQIEKNEIRTMIMRHRRVSIAKILSEVGNITPDELSKLIDGNSGGVVSVNNVASVKELVPQPVPAGLIESDQLTDREVQELLGMGANQFGEYAPGSADRSATEASIVAQATNIRIDENRDTCADVLVEIATDMNYLIAEHWDADMVLDVVGPQGVPLWIKFQPRLLKDAMYELKIDPDTSLPETKQLREQRANNLYDRQKTNPLIDPEHLTRYVLNETGGADANFLMRAAQTSPQNPMDMQGAVQGMQQAGNVTPLRGAA